MKSATAALSWVLLTVALALPAFMGWNWWKRVQRKGAEGAEAASRGTSKIFASNEASASNPLKGVPVPGSPSAAAAPSASTSTAAAPASKPGPAEPVAKAPSAETNPAVGATGPATASSPAQAPGASLPAGRQAGAAAKQVVAFAPKSDRDPFVSPGDLERVREDERRKELAALETERMKRDREKQRKEALKPKPTAPEPSVETRISLQGIIATAGQRSAIVNNERRNVGDVIFGARITSITEVAVTFSHRGRVFKKVIQR